jgi:hypothetical protein
MRKAPEQYRLRNHPFLGSDVSYGNNGFFVIPHFRVNNYELRCQISDGEGWEHVSVTVAPLKKEATRCPTWEEMCHVKDVFFDKDEVVIQFHPAESNYVSMHHFCLHLWKPTNYELPTPNPLMVGINQK